MYSTTPSRRHRVGFHSLDLQRSQTAGGVRTPAAAAPMHPRSAVFTAIDTSQGVVESGVAFIARMHAGGGVQEVVRDGGHGVGVRGHQGARGGPCRRRGV